MKFPTVSTLRSTSAAVLLVAGSAGPETAWGTNTAGVPHSPPPAGSVALSSGAQDILKLTRAKVNDDVTLAFIENSDRRYDLTAAEIIHLREAGVTDQVLAAMISHKPTSTGASPPAPSTAMAATAPVAAAPQYETAPTVVETSQPSTVYVTSATPAYYSFYDPWPYWYDPWPWYGYSYPYFSIGWYWGWGWGWGNCYYGYHGGCWDDDHCANTGHPPQNGNSSSSGNQTPARTPPTRGAGDSPATVAGGARPAGDRTAAASSAAARPEVARSTQTPPARPTSNWSNNENPSAGGNQRDTAVASASQSSRPSVSSGSGPAGRSVNQRGDQLARATQPTVRPDGSQSRAIPAGRSAAARPTSTWTSGNSQQATARAVATRNTIAVAPSSRVTGGPTANWSRPTAQPANRAQFANRSVARPTMQYSTSGRSPVYSSRATASSPSFSRPTMSPASRGAMSTGGFRASGGSGGSGPRMSSSSAGFRGGSSGGGRHR